MLKDQEKIEYVLNIVKNLQWIPKKFLKHIEELTDCSRSGFASFNSEFRIFCFFDAWHASCPTHRV